MTLTELHDARLDVIAHARGVLDRAISKGGAWCGNGAGWLRVLAAIGDLEDAIRAYDCAGLADLEAADRAVRDCGWKALQLVRIAEDVMGADAAEYISSGEEAP